MEQQKRFSIYFTDSYKEYVRYNKFGATWLTKWDLVSTYSTREEAILCKAKLEKYTEQNNEIGYYTIVEE